MLSMSKRLRYSSFLEITFQVGLLTTYPGSVGTLAGEDFSPQSEQIQPVYALFTCGPSAVEGNISPELTPKPPALELGVPKHLFRILTYHHGNCLQDSRYLIRRFSF